MEDQKHTHKKVQWMPGVCIISGIVVILVAFFIYVIKEATFAPSLGEYVAVKNPTADEGLVIILGSVVVIGVILISIGIFSWGRQQPH